MKEIDISPLKNAAETLKKAKHAEGMPAYGDVRDMLCDSCVKRFEYTLEIAIKTMRKFLKTVYGRTDEELTVNNSNL